MTIKRSLAISLLIVLATAVRAHADAVVQAAPWEFHNSFWTSLHQSLMDDVMSKAPRHWDGATAAEQSAWNEAVEAYRKVAPGHGDISFSQTMMATTYALARGADDGAEPPADAPVAAILKRAAPIYRAHGWSKDQEANRFFIAYASALVRAGGATLIRQHENVYRTPWPKKVLVYVTPAAGPYGAYTLNEGETVVTTMSCRDEGYQGLRALEMLMHESSHAVVDVNTGTVANAIAAAAKSHHIGVPRNLWHALLFETSGELTRRYLAERGVTTFVPSSVDLFNRAWPNYRDAVQKYWRPYLGGAGTLEDAVDKIVAEVGQPATK
jgi:hypothetical protein